MSSTRPLMETPIGDDDCLRKCGIFDDEYYRLLDSCNNNNLEFEMSTIFLHAVLYKVYAKNLSWAFTEIPQDLIVKDCKEFIKKSHIRAIEIIKSSNSNSRLTSIGDHWLRTVAKHKVPILILED